MYLKNNGFPIIELLVKIYRIKYLSQSVVKKICALVLTQLISQQILILQTILSSGSVNDKNICNMW